MRSREEGMQIIVLYTCTTRETWKKGCFLRLNVICVNCDKGSKCAYFSEKGSFWNLVQGVLGSFFKLHQTCPLKTLCRGKFGCKIIQHSRLGGVYPSEGKSRLGYILKTSGHACVQTLVFKCPPPRVEKWYYSTAVKHH